MLWPFTLWISYYKALRIVYLARPINFSCEQWQTLVIAKGWTLAKLLHPLPTPSLILSLPHSPSLSSLILSPLPSLPPLSLAPLPLKLHVFKSMYMVIWKWYHTMEMESYHTIIPNLSQGVWGPFFKIWKLFLQAAILVHWAPSFVD